ncbi:probable hexosyltransferase MUCI70 isoform X1 [Andrographis paniculata]|uniref:probable hexosyltransferase MUCI70 isoform X1 n=1 Tax=Andrographis paniculata TaxID=175694 RepID=UPI0021E7C688|nr:probable hexosyltransferase MUCI70 isoform X1 [Andrographis paniculata]
MGKIATFSKPLLFQSKLLCISLVYLFSALFFAAHFTFSATKCLFRWSPFDPVQAPLFSYPSSYGEHKHAIPTTRSSCDSPVYFSEYWKVLREMRRIGNDYGALRMRYMQGNNDRSFGGNLSVAKRFSYFDFRGDGIEVPCGFFIRFPISDYDRISMEMCDGLVVASAIFNDHDKIRQPRGVGSETLNSACFFMFVDDATLDRLHFHNMISKTSTESKIGAWRIVKVSSEQLYDDNPAMNGVIPKYLIHRLFPNSKYSIWIDAKLQLVVDPFLLIHSLVVKQNVDMAISRHPFFTHTMEEAMATARWKKWWNVNGIQLQMETYCEHGLQPWNSTKPYPTDVPDSALILRRHTLASNLFSCLMFSELDAFNHRDQLAFAFVRDKMKPQLKMNMFGVEVFEQVALEYRHNLKAGGASVGPKIKRALDSPDFLGNGKCDGYLSKMWGESHD